MDNNTNTNLGNKTANSGGSKPSNPSSAILVQFDAGLLDTLRARHNSRYSRSEAFIDLLLRMRSIDKASENTTANLQTGASHNSNNPSAAQSPAQQPSLFDNQPKAQHGASPQASPSYSGAPTGDFMSRHCLTNYSQLAAAWHWNRQTVLTFLRSLESDGVILFEQKNKTVEIYI